MASIIKKRTIAVDADPTVDGQVSSVPLKNKNADQVFTAAITAKWKTVTSRPLS